MIKRRKRRGGYIHKPRRYGLKTDTCICFGRVQRARVHACECVFYARVCIMHRSTAGCRNRSQQHLSAAVMLIGSQFKEFFPLQMGVAGKRKMHTRRCIRIRTHARTFTQTDLGRIFYFLFLDFHKAPSSFQMCPFGGGKKTKQEDMEAKRLRACGRRTCVFFFCQRCEPNRLWLKMLRGLPARHRCQETFLTSLKSRLVGNKNKFT